MAQQATTGDPNLFANYLNNGWSTAGNGSYINTPNTGPWIMLSGVTSVPFPTVINAPNLSIPQPWMQPSITINTPNITFTPYATSTGSNNFSGMHKEQFVTFVRAHLTGKCLVFVEQGKDTYRIVNRIEALKFVWFHFINLFATPQYQSYKELKYQDEEWTIFFKPAETSEELLESFDFTFEQICDALSI